MCLFKVTQLGYTTFHSHFKTLFNLWRLHLKIVELWCLGCMMMFTTGPINSQECKSFEILCSHYQDIYGDRNMYHWVNPVGRLTVYLTQQCYGEKCVKFSGLHYTVYSIIFKLLATISWTDRLIDFFYYFHLILSVFFWRVKSLNTIAYKFHKSKVYLCRFVVAVVNLYWEFSPTCTCIKMWSSQDHDSNWNRYSKCCHWQAGLTPGRGGGGGTRPKFW